MHSFVTTRTTAHEQNSRKRQHRSVDDFEEGAKSTDMIELARNLFSEELKESDSYLHRNGFIEPIGQRIQKLVDDVVDAKKSFEQFVHAITVGTEEFTLFTMEPPRSNETVNAVTPSGPLVTAN